MGVFFLIALIVPLVIYYILIVPLVKIGIINRIESKRKKAIFFWLLMFFPVGDHIVGYVVYKALCFSIGGVHIYKTVTDEAEQRAYWIDSYFGIRAPNSNGERYGIESRIYLTKDLKQHQIAYMNQCETKRWKSYDCEKADEYIKEHHLKVYELEKEKIDISRSTRNQDYIKDSSLRITRVIGDTKLEFAYLNYCDAQYETLLKDDPNYYRSCKNADELIAQYHLENVIKVPKSSYSVFTSRITLLPLLITIDSSRVIHTATKEKLGVNREITFYGGWWFNVAGSMFGHNKGWSFGSMFENDFKQKIIPNPYKQQINQGIAK